MGERVRVEGSDAWAHHSEGDGPPVVVLAEYWGVVPQICGVADRLAAEGFRVAVPDLYGGATTDDRETAAQLMTGLDVGTGCRWVQHTIDWLGGGRTPVGVVGFCMGGGLALVAASSLRSIGAAVVFYGAVPWDDVTLAWSERTPPLQLHYAEQDGWASPDFGRSVAEGVAGAGGTAELWRYDAQHAFLDETRPESHDPAAASVAWRRAVEFLRRHLT